MSYVFSISAPAAPIPLWVSAPKVEDLFAALHGIDFTLLGYVCEEAPDIDYFLPGEANKLRLHLSSMRTT